ncbi:MULTISPECIES: hypothetical protein [unclassified Dietzia]|uniref:hypothetical protein n=1 Tax=unclassified Dietzia TaxID=2617939 RepID=UPI0012E82307|nr:MULTISPECIES: hypothetical protein [unclassified Dietzia]
MPSYVALPGSADKWIDIPASSKQVFTTWARIDGNRPSGLNRADEFANGLKMFTLKISQTAWGDAECVYLRTFMRAPVGKKDHTHVVVDEVRKTLTRYSTPTIRFAYSFYSALYATRPEGVHGDGLSKFRDRVAKSLVRLREVMESPDEADVLRSQERARRIADLIQAESVNAQDSGLGGISPELVDIAVLLATKGSLRLVSEIERFVHWIDGSESPRVTGWTEEMIEDATSRLWEWLEINTTDLVPAGPGRDKLIREMLERLERLSFETPSMLACSYGLHEYVRSPSKRNSLDKLTLDKAHTYLSVESQKAERYANPVAELAYRPALEKAADKAARSAWEEGSISDDELLGRFWASYWGEHKRGNLTRPVSLEALGVAEDRGESQVDYMSSRSVAKGKSVGSEQGQWMYRDFEGALVSRLDREKIFNGVRSLLDESAEADVSTPIKERRVEELSAVLLNAGGSFELDQAIAATESFDTLLPALFRTEDFAEDIRHAYASGAPESAICTKPEDALTVISTLLSKALDAYGYHITLDAYRYRIDKSTLF